MNIVLNENDLNSLSSPALKEIYSLIGSQNLDSSSLPKSQDEEDKPYDMTAHMTKKFMSGVAEKTKHFLKVFADNDGKGKVDDLLKATNSKIFIIGYLS